MDEVNEIDKIEKIKSNINIKSFVVRVIMYVFSIFISTIGVAFAINGRLGISPVNSLPYVVSNILGVYMGMVATTILIFFLLAQIIILRKDFKWIQVTQILASFLFGYFVDISRGIIGDFVIPTYFGQLAMTFISILLIGTGISLFMSAKLVNLPPEGLIAAISQKYGFPIYKVMITIHSVTVLTGIVLSLTFLGELIGIREGTVLSALLIGKVVQYVKPVVGKGMERFGIE